MKAFLARLSVFTATFIVLLPSVAYAGSFYNCSSIDDATERQECEQRRSLFLNSGIIFYCPGGTTNPLVVNLDVNVTGGDAAEKVWNGLISAGFTPEQAAGIMGNLQSESGLNPARTNGLLAQWLGGRRDNILNLIRSTDPNLLQYVTSPEFENGSGNDFIAKAGDQVADALYAIEIQFLVDEMRDRGTRTNNSNFNEVYPGGKELDVIKSMNDAKEVAAFFRWSFERPCSSIEGRNCSDTITTEPINRTSREGRQTAAEGYLQMAQSGNWSGGSSSSSGSSGGGSYSIASTDNCVATGDSPSEGVGGNGSSIACGPSNITPGSLPSKNINGNAYAFPVPSGTYTFPVPSQNGADTLRTGTHNPAKENKEDTDNIDAKGHAGGKDAVDIFDSGCTPVVAITTGTILMVKTRAPGDYDEYVNEDQLSIKAGNAIFYYTHMQGGSAVGAVRQGQTVTVGQFVGNISHSTTHLHISFSPDGSGTSDKHNSPSSRQVMAPLLNDIQGR